MDGVLTDSEPAFYAGINDVLATYGCHVGMAQYTPLIGSATPFTWSSLIEWFSLPVVLDDVIEEYEPLLQARLREPRDALPGVRELVETLRSRGVPVALCTASYMRWVEPILEGAGLTGMFDAMSTADMVERTKPAPTPYVHAAELLGLSAWGVYGNRGQPKRGRQNGRPGGKIGWPSAPVRATCGPSSRLSFALGLVAW